MVKLWEIWGKPGYSWEGKWDDGMMGNKHGQLTWGEIEWVKLSKLLKRGLRRNIKGEIWR